MWRRHASDQSDLAPADPDPDSESESAIDAWARWEERWSRPEEERVARWLGVKGNNDDRTATAVTEEERRLAPDLEPHEWQAFAVPQEAARESLKAELAALEEHRRQVATALAAEQSELAMVEHRKRQLVAELEAERVEIHGERRRLVTALHEEQLEVERVRRGWTQAKAERDAEMSALDEQRRRLVEAAESAVAAAEHAAMTEIAAVARLEAAEEQANREEAQRFEVWVALDAEITALEERRQQLRGGTGDDRA